MSLADITGEGGAETRIYSPKEIAQQLAYLDRAHKMTSSDHLNKETPYSRSAGMIRQLLASNGENP